MAAIAAPVAGSSAARQPASASSTLLGEQRARVKHLISQVVLHIVSKLTGANFEDVVDGSLQVLIEKHVPVRIPRRPTHRARMLDDRADLKLWRFIAVMKACMEVLDRGPGSTTTKRSIYYSDADLFGNKQSICDRAIEQTVITLANIDGSFGQFARHSLGIVAAKRGQVYGQLIYKLPDGTRHNCAQGTGWSIEPWAEGGTVFLHPDVDRVVIVEKETVFNRLAQAANDMSAPAWLQRSVIITGKGYPDVATRIFVRALLDPANYSQNSPKPADMNVYGLMDGDPHGLDILSVYINGSRAKAYAGQALRIPEIMWLGIRHSDIAKLCVPQHALLPFGLRDHSVTTRLLSDPDRLAAVHASAAEHLQALAQSGMKAEIECLYETELGLFAYIDRAMKDASSEPARPIYNPSSSKSVASSTTAMQLDSGSETEDESAAGKAASTAASDFDWSMSEDECDDNGGAMLCKKCGKWVDIQRVRDDTCYVCWRRQSNISVEEPLEDHLNPIMEPMEDFESD